MSKTIEQLFLAEINPHKECNFVLAISGGVDSMVLANLFLINNLKFSIAHCNFQLRGKESDDDELFINKWCSEKDIKFYNKKFSTEDYCKNNKLTIQMAARELRYEWFRELIDKEKYDFIVTAHHIDDQLETLFAIKSREELVGDIIMLLQSPAKNLVSALSSGGGRLSGILQTLSNK